jgi:dTDP-4-amino-4,6-dideoxygalactose transaminase
MRQFIPHSRPSTGAAETRAAARVLRGGRLAGGPELAGFERDLERFLGGGRATAVQSGSAALHLALLALGVGPRDRVVLPTYVCAAVLNAVRYVGAEPILADVDPSTANLDPGDVRRRLRARTAALIVPHMFGRPAPLRELRALGVPVVEDCAMSLGGTTGLGGEVSVFSFYATKMIATGHGGMVVARDPRLAARVRDLVDYDKREDARLRWNYRMSDLAAAVGRAQLARLPEFVKRRRAIAELYYRELGLGRTEPGHVYYRFVLRVGAVGPFVRSMMARGVECKRPVFRPLHRLLGRAAGDYRGAEELHRSWASVPLYPALRPREVDRVARALRGCLA